MGKVWARVVVVTVGGLLVSCQPATEETGGVDLSLLDWIGYDIPKYYPEFTARYDGQPAFRADTQAITDEKHPDHQLQIDRRTPGMAVIGCQMLA